MIRGAVVAALSTLPWLAAPPPPVRAGGDPICALGPTACVPPTIHLRGVPRICTVVDFRLRVRVEHPVALRRVRVRLDAATLARTRAKRLTVRVAAARLRPGAHRLRVLAVDRYGVASERRRQVRRCDPA